MFSRFSQTGARAAGTLVRRSTLTAGIGRRLRSYTTKSLADDAVSRIKGVNILSQGAVIGTFVAGIVGLKCIEVVPAGQVGIVDLFGK